MTDRAFASWVEPIAEQLRESRVQIADVARAAPPDAWKKPSPNEGWTCKDLLAHLATGDWVLQMVLKAVTSDTPVNIGEVGDLDFISEGNARRLKERAGCSPEELIEEVEAERMATQELLSRLTEADESRSQEDAPIKLGDYLRGFPGHDRQHLEELRKGARGERAMTARTFVAWVEPLATRMGESRARTLEYARSLSAEAWSRPTGNEGWTCKDVFAHIGKGNDQMFQAILREVVAGRQVDRSIFAIDTDGENKRRVAERRGRSVAEIIAELEASGDEVQELLSQFTDTHEGYQQDDPPFILSGFMRLVLNEDHDGEHLAQIRAALEEHAS